MFNNTRIRTLALATFLFASIGAVNFANAAPNDAASESQTSRGEGTFPPIKEVTQEGMKPHVGITLGAVNPEGAFSTGAEYGFNAGFQPIIPFGLGIAITSARAGSQTSGVRDIERATAMIRGTYNFGGEIPVIKNSYVGLATGPVFNQDAMYMGLAPVIGFDVPVREWTGDYLSYLSVGVDARYLMVSNEESDALSVNGALKYWF